MEELKKQKCVPCSGNSPAATPEEIKQWREEILEWKVNEEDAEPRLEREFKFKDFSDALTFTFKVGEEANREDHHPVIITEWGKVTVKWWTHKIHGLHRNDFIMAAKTDEIYMKFQ